MKFLGRKRVRTCLSMLLIVTCLLVSFSFYIDTRAADTIGIVRFKSPDDLVDYVEVDSGRTGYFNYKYGADAAYIRTEGSGAQEYVICKLAGVVMKVNKQQFVEKIVAYQDQKISYYSSPDNIYLMHTYTYYSGSTITTRSICVGYKPSYLTRGINYYSYDGHYFYTEFDKMISDYRNNTYGNAVNVNAPYYNYYQYLSMHSMSNCTAGHFDSHVAAKTSSSKMLTTGSTFVATQNKYTINSLLMFGVAINESDWGRSSIANTKNNLFGLKAFDSNPTENAKVFATVDACIEDFAYGWIHKGYLNGKDGRYRGPHLGDKRSGINVQYASDPYWGEKAAVNCFNAGKSDYGRYTLGIVRSNIINFYKEADTSSNVIYTSDASNGSYIYDFPVTILEKVTNARGELFYKVASDMSLRDDRSARDEGYDSKNQKPVAVYDSNRDYVFVRASDIQIVFENGANITIPETSGQGKTQAEVLAMMQVVSVDNYLTGFAVGSDVSTEIAKVRAADSSIQIVVKNSNGAEIAGGTIATGMTITVTTNGSTVNYSVVVRGDLNGDGKMSAVDYVKIRNYLDRASSLSGAYLKSADTNGDGNVTALDYVKVRNHLDGKSAIVQ